MTSLLYGLHDREGRDIVPAGGWIVDTVALSENPAPMNYAAMRSDINWIVRLNWGYGTTGTIPLPDQYQEFANRCADYVARSNGADRFIIGNEPNHEQERPNGVYITPEQYARCFKLCRDAIKRVRLDAQVIPAPCAPYHANPVDWLEYWRTVLEILGPDECDGLAIHAYTRSSNPADIDSDATMGPPLEDQFSGFYTYQDARLAVPSNMEHLPVYITEFNELLPEGWHDANTGVVQAAYADINESNRAEDGLLPIMCLILYRWPKYDKWYIEGKNGVIADFQAAVAMGYQSPSVSGASEMGEKTFIPAVSNETSAPKPIVPPRKWDERLTQRGVTVETPALAPGQHYWRAAEARWYDEQESQGRHHIYADASNGTPLLVKWPSGESIFQANGRGGFDAGNFPLSPSRNEFSVQVRDGRHPSEVVKGIGMGSDTPGGFNAGTHTSTGVTFEMAIAPFTSQPTKPTPQPVPQPEPTPQPPTGDNFPRAMAFVREWEGGYVDHPSDPGGATNKGITIGTFIRWRVEKGLPTPTKEDLRNLTDAEATDIYREWYWKASGSDKLPWPLALANFDTAVNAGVGRADEMLQKSNGNFLLYMGELIDWYTRIPNFEHFGKAWIRRRADLLKEAAK